MKYHVIHCETLQLKTLSRADVINMEEDAEGRIVVYEAGEQKYYLLADIDLIKD
ncbi:hypothetical protein ACFQ88_30735 [Paenibacillus sp. NPDC056579]|uniref:hypothetical protein n=1 Tax=unclassified Paenibacillus TaxID=185978 RepID=UPI001EF7A19E|nr:hypothetical protein [Paenibacillus sp. H1-7]